MSLSPLERQVVLLAVSAHNRCDYCTAAHSMLATMNGLDRAEVERVQNGDVLRDQRLEALRRFATAVVEQHGRPTQRQLDDFGAAGFGPAQVLEVVLGVATKTLTNYANHIANPPVNEQFSGYLPKWAAASPVAAVS